MDKKSIATAYVESVDGEREFSIDLVIFKGIEWHAEARATIYDGEKTHVGTKIGLLSETYVVAQGALANAREKAGDDQPTNHVFREAAVSTARWANSIWRAHLGGADNLKTTNHIAIMSKLGTWEFTFTVEGEITPNKYSRAEICLEWNGDIVATDANASVDSAKRALDAHTSWQVAYHSPAYGLEKHVPTESQLVQFKGAVIKEYDRLYHFLSSEEVKW